MIPSLEGSRLGTYPHETVKNQTGFTLIELVVVVALLGILIPLISSLIFNAYNQYAVISATNRLSVSADTALRSVLDDIRLLNLIQTADENNLHFTLIGGGERYYRFDSGTLQLCMESCVNSQNDPVPESFGILAKNVNVDESSFKFYRSGGVLDANEIPSFESLNATASDLLVAYIMVEFELVSVNMEMPFHIIVRPGHPT